MQVQTQLSWSERIAETICRQRDREGYHVFPSERWAYVQGMTLMAMARTGKQYGKDEYVSFMKRHMDLYVQEDGSIGTYSLEEYNLDQINQGKNLFKLLETTGDVGEQIVSDSFMGVAPLLLAALEMERLP